MFLQRKYQGIEKSWHAFVAGFLGGYLIFGDEFSPVNKQVKNGSDRNHLCLVIFRYNRNSRIPIRSNDI